MKLVRRVGWLTSGRFFRLLGAALLVFGGVVAHAACDCGATDGTAVCRGQTVARTHHGSTFGWQFSCDGGECLCGRFNNGEYWVAHPGGGEVFLEATAPQGGLEANPQTADKQGLLACASNYDPARNLEPRLPQPVAAGTSLVKAQAQRSGCGAPSIESCCVRNYETLTVLEAPPPGNGANVFRPGVADPSKRLFSEQEFDYDRLPRYAAVDAATGRTALPAIVATWSGTYVDHFMSSLGDAGRAFWPHGVGGLDYGAAQARDYNNALLSLMGTESGTAKRIAVNAMLQRGLDLYTSWQAGITWPSGAGQQMGRKPPIAFFAALVRDSDIQAEVRSMPLTATQEDSQIRQLPGEGRIPVWGDYPGTHISNKFCSAPHYWSQLFRGDNKRTCGDPYGYIDGPAGEPGSAYMKCCSTSNFVAYVLAMRMMPALCDVGRKPALIAYVDRVYDPARKRGVHTQPDPCAPPDPRESSACEPHTKAATGCRYYGVTWGEDQAAPGRCVPNNSGGNTGQQGRHPGRHGFDISTDLDYMPDVVPALWATFGSNVEGCQGSAASPPPSPPSPPQNLRLERIAW